MYLDYYNIPEELEAFLRGIHPELRQQFLRQMDGWCCSRNWLELRIDIIRLISFAVGCGLCFSPNTSIAAERRYSKKRGQHLVIWEEKKWKR